MIMIITLFLYALIVCFELLPLLKSNQKKMPYLYTSFLAISFIIAILISMNVEIPSPMYPIQTVIKFIIDN